MAKKLFITLAVLVGMVSLFTACVPIEGSVDSIIEKVSGKSGTKTYTVKFASNGGTAVPDQKVKEGETVLQPTDPARQGWAFTNW